MRYFLIFLVLLAPTLLNAQKNYRPGSYTDNQGKVHSGFINFREWIKNPKVIEFTVSGSDKDIVQFSPRDIDEFEITGAEKYERKVCRISTAAVAMGQLSVGIDSSYRIDTVFLKELEKGKINLYVYTDEIKQRFFISTSDHPQPYELIYNVYQDVEKELSIIEDKAYVAQLISAGIPESRIPRITSMISSTRYDEDDILKVVRILNNGGRSVKSSGGKPSLQIRVGSGISIASMEMEGYRGLFLATSEYSFNSSVSPLFYAGMNIYFNPATSKLLLMTDLSYASFKHTGNAKKSTIEYNYTYKFDLNYSSLVFYLGPAYNFVKTDAMEAYLSAGPAIQIMNFTKNHEHGKQVSTVTPYTTNEFNVDEISPQATAIGLCLRAGLAFRNKLEFGINFRSGRGNIFTYEFFRNRASYVDFRIGYKFTTSKK